jgi:hypothetical protein
MESLDALEASLSWSEFSATIACGVVAVGLVIEYKAEIKEAILKHSIRLLPLGAMLVTIGVAAEFAFQIRTSILLSHVRDIQQKEASAANQRAANTEKAAAEARERAAKAELELAKMTSPRVISGPNFAKMMNLFRAQEGKTFWVIVERNDPDVLSEQQALGDQLKRLFAASRWTPDSHWSRLDEGKVDPDHTPVSDRGCQVAVSVQSLALGNLVVDALREAEIDCLSSIDDEIKPDHVIVTVALR